MNVDPLAEKYPGWSPYNYTMNNPLRFIDPDGRSVDEADDIIFKNKKDEELGRIILPGDHIYVEIGTDLSIEDPIVFDPVEEAEKLGIENLDAVGLSIDYAGVLGGGIEAGLEFVYMLQGEDEGNLYGFKNLGGGVGLDGEIGVSGKAYTFNREAESKFFSAKGMEGKYNGYSIGGYSYSWSNEKNKAQIYPGGFGSRKSTVTWESHSIGGGVGGNLGAKWSSGKSTLMNNGKPLSSTYLSQQHKIMYAK